MRIYVSDPDAVIDVAAFLRERPDVIAVALDEHEIEASILGSHRHDALEMELDLRLQVWRAAHPDVEVRVLGS